LLKRRRERLAGLRVLSRDLLRALEDHLSRLAARAACGGRLRRRLWVRGVRRGRRRGCRTLVGQRPVDPLAQARGCLRQARTLLFERDPRLLAGVVALPLAHCCWISWPAT
jgi:hypothetical protein